jgi:molybdopterin synthase catalytic subunit
MTSVPLTPISAPSPNLAPVFSGLPQPSPPDDRDRFAITFAPLDWQRVQNQAEDPGNGAVVIMGGTVRQQTNGRPVVALDYQAYEPMALVVFQAIATQIRHHWPQVNRVVIHHRTGRLAVGETSVLVAVGCPHRGEAFAACQYAIDTLKHQAPIWKKELWADGSSSWVSLAACEEDSPRVL